MYFLDDEDFGHLAKKFSKELKDLSVPFDGYSEPCTNFSIAQQRGENGSGIYARIQFYGSLAKEKLCYGGFDLYGYPNNCGAVILTNFRIGPRLRNKGIAKHLFTFLDDFVADMGYSFITCTAQTEHQARFIALAKKNKFKEDSNFLNTRSENHITCLSKEIQGE